MRCSRVIGTVVAGFIVEGLAEIAIVSILVNEFVVNPLIGVGATTVQAADRFSGAARIFITQIAAGRHSSSSSTSPTS